MRWAGYLESQVVGKVMKRPGALSVATVTDVFVGGVLYTRLAWVIGFASFVARGGSASFPSACYCVIQKV